MGGGVCGWELVGDKQRLRQKGQAVNKDCDILNAIHKVPRYIDGSLLTALPKWLPNMFNWDRQSARTDSSAYFTKFNMSI